jgi:hypothetical protein
MHAHFAAASLPAARMTSGVAHFGLLRALRHGATLCERRAALFCAFSHPADS